MSSFDEERIVYRDKIGKARDAIDKLLNISVEHDSLFGHELISKLKTYRKKCDKLYTKLDKNEFEIAIVGLEKAGKSTFGNALMGNNVLPNADERCTYTSTCIRYGQDRAVVTFLNASEVNEVLRGYLKTLGISDAESHTLDNLALSSYKVLFNNLDKKDQDRYENTVHQDILNFLENKQKILSYIGQPPKTFENDELESDEFRDFIVNPKVAVAVKEVCIESSKIEKMSNAIIYDVPGFDSPTAMHLEQTKKRMKEADAIMLIASAEKPSFTAPALKIFNEVSDEDNVNLTEKLFIFGNRADAANTLAKNISTLKSEASKWKLLDRHNIEKRIVVGSARAHLQMLKVIDGTDCSDKVANDVNYKQAWQYGDGIDHIYQKLVDYNETDRFEIIQKKVKRTIEELKELFSDLKARNSTSAVSIDVMRKTMEEQEKLRERASKLITSELETLRLKIREKYREDMLLSKRLQSEITDLFSDEHINQYLISEDDITWAKRKIIDISGSTNPEKVEELIRENKFKLIYDDFSKAAFSVAQNDHSDYYNQILDIFISSLGIDKKASSYDQILSNIKSFIEASRQISEDEYAYQSLIERFVRDLVEILISRPYSSEARLNKFIDEAEIFSGLVMFYNNGDADSGYRTQFLSVPPKNQPLLLALVFHEFKNISETCRSFLNSLNEYQSADKTEFLRLGLAIIKRDPVNGLASVIRILQGKPKDDKYPMLELRNLEKDLKASSKDRAYSDIMRYDFDFSNKDKFAQQYKQFFGNTEVRNYDNVIASFRIDLDILKDFLLHASIPAIKLEKPFVAREVQSITRLLDSVKDNFGTFIVDNAQLLLSKSMNDVSVRIENIVANKEAISAIEQILNTLNE